MEMCRNGSMRSETSSRFPLFPPEKRKDFVIDDITWNDLDIIDIYMLVNQTMSSPGEDVLYAMMRTPFLTERSRGGAMHWLIFLPPIRRKREKVQVMLSSVGKTSQGSLSDTVLSLNEAPKASPLPHGIMAVLLVLVCWCFCRFRPCTVFCLLCAQHDKYRILFCMQRQKSWWRPIWSASEAFSGCSLPQMSWRRQNGRRPGSRWMP